MKNLIYITLVSAFIFTGCAESKKENKEEQKKEMGGMMMMNPFETVPVKKINPLVILKLAGELQPDQSTELFAKVNSYVKNIRVDIGDRVSEGQILMTLEAREIQSQVATAKAKFKAQQAVYVSTLATYDRMVKANQTAGAIARDAMDQITARKLSDQAQLVAAESAYHEIRNIDDYLVIRAPFNGIITDRSVDLGAYVGPMGKSPLLVVQNNQKLRLNLSIPEANTPFIKLGDTIQFYVRSQPQHKYFAKISRKSGSLDLKLRSEKVEADFINTNNALKPFMIAETQIPLQNSEATFFVPKSAVVDSNMGMYVIAVEGGKARKIAVSKGRVMPEMVEVLGELAEDTVILKMGNEEIQDGSAIPNK
ncbi:MULTISPECIES: efflux RND transporter periplasmic adaptor subunit [Sphingobacterium]|uniref:efflux RND transporter periplasmic adaptor subunit n=1 Tax=Sphingobacterium TaxID=28453 RepID=UPI001616C2FA|nr:efflux RND transporter periplasmic adaptor subunit [Sphingobacterium sp. JUb56]MBB2950525.1 RND family efflux transporter MFP subunit [Sphingobacterium sp. JUb56]